MSKIGAHVNPGPRDGYGPFAASKPAVCLLVGQDPAETEIKSDGATVTIFRADSVYGEAPPGYTDHPDPAALAGLWYPALKAKWLLNSADYYQITNEQGGGEGPDVPGNLTHLVAFERKIMQLANADGLKVCVLNLATGSPGSLETWKQICAPFVAEAWAAGNIYGRHAYGTGDLVTASGSVIAGSPIRPFEELAHLKTVLGKSGGMALTECGLDMGFGFAGKERVLGQMAGYEQALRPFAEMIGFCWWSLGNAPGNPNWQSITGDVAAYNLANPTPPWEWPEDPEPPPAQSLEQQLWDISVAEQIARGIPLNPGAALQQAIFANGQTPVMRERQPVVEGEAYTIQAGESVDGSKPRRVYVWQPGQTIWFFTKPGPPPGPVFGFQAYPVRGQPYIINDPFNAPRPSYPPSTNQLHEGVDLYAPPGSEVVAAAAGVVEKVGDDGSQGLGKWVFVRHSERYGTKYGHLSVISVSQGLSIAAGQKLGLSGSTGNSTGPHLHLTLDDKQGLGGYYYAGKVADPTPFLDAVGASGTGGVAMGPYFMPAVGDFGDIVILKNNWGAGDERQQLQRAGNFSYVTKNNQWEKREVLGDGIHLRLDTSPGNGEYYTVEGSAWLPAMWQVGEEFTRTETVRFFRKSDCQATKPAYTSMSKIRFEQLWVSGWSSPAGIAVADVIELQWIVNGLVEETYWYGKGLGLVEWQNRAGRHSWITERIPVGQQGNNVRESGCFGQ